MTSIGQFVNQNPNNAASNKWLLTIGDLALITRKIHDFSIPGIYSEGVDGPSPGNSLLQISSERLTFDPVIFTFVVDEDWKNWEQVYNWITSNAASDQPSEKEVVIQLLDNLNRPVGFQINLEFARPTALDNIILDVDGENSVLICTVTFRYQTMKPVRTV